jgi:hypothetical protein
MIPLTGHGPVYDLPIIFQKKFRRFYFKRNIKSMYLDAIQVPDSLTG